MIKEINLNELRPNQLPHRPYAHPFDFKIDCDSAPHGVGRDPDSIDGHRAMGWYEVYRDHKTNELFLVHCYDGERRGKSAHTDGHLQWVEEVWPKIIERTYIDAGSSKPFITLSSAEWAIMRKRVFHGWLDTMDRETTSAMRAKTEGCIGKICGIEVRVDPQAPNPLGEPIDLESAHEETKRDPLVKELSDYFETLAAAHGYEDY